MPDTQFVEERRDAILRHLDQHGRVSVNTLSEEMGVSAVTIRQDLRLLEQAGLLKRTYGGAIRRVSASTIPEMAFNTRLGLNARAKNAIGAAAAAMVHDGDSLALDASTTAAALIPYLKQRAELTIVTNSLYIAQGFLDSPHIQVLMPGGRLRRDAISLVGRPELLPHINLTIGFFGAVGISIAGGVTDVDPDEVLIKQALIKRCARSIIVADSDKWGRTAPYTVIAPEAISHIISTVGTPSSVIEWFELHGADVNLVAVD